MKVYLLLPILYLVLMSINVTSQTIDSGIIKQEKREFSNFSSIEINNIPGEVDIYFGDTKSVLITADSSVVSSIDTQQENNILRLFPKNNIFTRSPIKIKIETTDLSSISIDGSSNISIHGINTEKLIINSNGSSSFFGYGSVGILDINIHGNGKLDFRKVNTKDCMITINGNGSADVKAGRNLVITINGIGNIFYHGEPVNIIKNITGIGEVSRYY